jgi:hypothetical protein
MEVAVRQTRIALNLRAPHVKHARSHMVEMDHFKCRILQAYAV